MRAQDCPDPTVMPVDRESWGRQLNLCNFVNAYYQLRDLSDCGSLRTVLMVGPGQGLETAVLGWRGFRVVTLDIDKTFAPDFVGSVHNMDMFRDGAFDAVVVSHVLEHLPLPFLAPSLAEIARVGRFALVYLPVAGRHVQARFNSSLKVVQLSLIMDVFNFMRKPSGVTADYCSGMHFWEVGRRGFSVRDMEKRFQVNFDVVRSYRNKDWIQSYNFVLKSKRQSLPGGAGR